MWTSARLLAVATACLALAVSTARAQEEEQPRPDVRCPVPALTSTDVTEVPTEWQRAPRKGNLGRTLVENRGGNSILVCTYGVAGNLSQELPDAYQSCVPVEGGFACQRRTRERVFLSRGEIMLTPGRGADLDRGRLVDDLPQSDIAFAGFRDSGAATALPRSWNRSMIPSSAFRRTTPTIPATAPAPNCGRTA